MATLKIGDDKKQKSNDKNQAMLLSTGSAKGGQYGRDRSKNSQGKNAKSPRGSPNPHNKQQKQMSPRGSLTSQNIQVQYAQKQKQGNKDINQR